MRALLLSLVLLCGCDESPATDAGTDTDAARPDAARPDAGSDEDSGVDAGIPDPPGPWTVYVTVGGENRLAVVDLGEDGSATERTADSLGLPGRPGPMGRDPASGRLFVGMGGASSGFATVSVDGSGVPSLDGTTSGPNPVYVAYAPGERVVTAYFGGDELRVHDVSGSPAHTMLDTLASDDEPHAAIFGPSGSIYVPHRNGETTWWLRLNTDGTLTMEGGLASETGVGPRHIAFHPTDDFAYVVNEYTESVSTHTVAGDGSLTRVETVSALAGGPSDTNTAADIHVTEDGRFVYSSNRGDDSIARFSIGADGLLTFLGTTSTEARPREFELTAGGGYLLSLGQDSGFMAVYRIEDDGDLTEVDRLDIGPNLLWAIAVPR